jgi:hypothetical protein
MIRVIHAGEADERTAKREERLVNVGTPTREPPHTCIVVAASTTDGSLTFFIAP